MEELQNFTPFDEITQTKELQILKTLIPYIPAENQHQIILLIEYLQFQKCMSALSEKTGALCALNVTSPIEKANQFLNEIKKFCTPAEQETINTISNLLYMMDGIQNG